MKLWPLGEGGRKDGKMACCPCARTARGLTKPSLDARSRSIRIPTIPSPYLSRLLDHHNRRRS